MSCASVCNRTWSRSSVPEMAQGSSREESANIEKLFWGPTSVKLDDEGRMYVVESCRYRIQVYQRG